MLPELVWFLNKVWRWDQPDLIELILENKWEGIPQQFTRCEEYVSSREGFKNHYSFYVGPDYVGTWIPGRPTEAS